MSEAYINNKILQWARVRAELTVEDLAKKYAKYREWENGEKKPTFIQAFNLAKKFCIPFGYLYLSSPPEEKKLSLDLRTFRDNQIHDYSIDLQDVISDAIRKQDWYKEYLLEQQSTELSFIGKYGQSDSSQIIAEDISHTLRLELNDRKGISKDRFLNYLVEHAEEAGILVLRSGKVGSNTHRKLDTEEFKGFALADSISPLIFINATDYTPAQIFTLVHELAHLWIGEGGVINTDITSNEYSQVERFCNQIATEVLVPKEDFIERWQSNQPLQEQAEQLENIYKVSSIVVARRALDLELVSNAQFYMYYKILLARWKSLKSKRSGGDYYKTLPIANSRIFTESVCNAVLSGRTLIREGAHLVNAKPSTLIAYAKGMAP